MTHRVPVTRFYIDQLDSLNGGRDLRGQLTCFLACTGIGKSHIARYVGKQACMMDGLDVLHVQLEGSESEVFNAYSASFIQRSTFDYENCKFTAEQLKEFEDQLKAVAGSVKIKAYTKFACDVSTRDVRNTIQEYIKFYGKTPDVVIIDSMDLLTDSSGRHYTEKGERLKRISVANDLKDMASDIDAWFIVTYQATFENKDWLDDEKNVLSAENIAEAKGIARPVTHLITLNQSSQERQDATMRLFVAKARFWKPSKVFKIATDYQNEQFYDRQRSITLAMTQ
jgi:replicative DNA helicase